MSLTPGLHTDIAANRYHADDLCDVPTLSSSIAGILLGATPRHAWWAHPRLNPDYNPDDGSDAMDKGSVAHEIVLGKGGGIAVLEFDNFLTKAAKEARQEARNAGLTPILAKTMDEARIIADRVQGALRSTEGCQDFEAGNSEVVGIWRDIGGPTCRMMLDRLTPSVAYDIKTTGRGLSDWTLQKRIESGLDLQAAFYLRGLCALFPEMAGRWRWRWIFVEAEAPFEVRIIEAAGDALTLGDRKAALAIEKWRRCLSTDTWPGYPRKVERVDLPGWAEERLMEREQADADAAKMVVSTRPIPEIRKSIIAGDSLFEVTP